MRKLLLIGGGGHCRTVLDSLKDNTLYSDIAILDRRSRIGEKVLNATIIGSDKDLERLKAEGYTDAFVAFGSFENSSIRISFHNIISEMGYLLPTIIDKTAAVSSYATLRNGIFIGKNATIGACTVVENGAIINIGAVVDHDCHIGKHSHVSQGVILCGNVTIKNNSHIGAGSVVSQGITIGNNVYIGVGSVVLEDLPDNVKVMGNPCRIIH